MEIAAFKVKSRIISTWATEVYLMQTQFVWIPDLKTYQPTKF
jgi:hypothetical protein